jgi:hypothetical protein
MYLAWVYQADLIDMAIHDAVPKVDRVHIHFTHATKYSVGPTRGPAGREGGVEVHGSCTTPTVQVSLFLTLAATVIQCRRRRGSCLVTSASGP